MDLFPAQNAFAAHCGINFMMGADFPNHEAPRAFGVYDEERETNRRVTFIIDKSGVIRHVIDDPRDMERHSQESLNINQSWG